MTSQQRQSQTIPLGLLQPRSFQKPSSGRALLVFLLCFEWSPDVVIAIICGRYIATCAVKACGLKAHAHKCGFVHTIWFAASIGLAMPG
ncbi:hypothetical protein P691DRAFT_801042 [Macrolepiota fuliginosa MF-IS2]|uniref:Uncharacterized protein n=1 Tax=Macrolepiota fuliginosa MF-IS2 TaxID=1400762 RepID=A0A9P5XBE9_9AGAR|nr:hypothetical protein P691DRAFT_801042 [Macrolepiota fuliginosa MF-IS2]